MDPGGKVDFERGLTRLFQVELGLFGIVRVHRNVGREISVGRRDGVIVSGPAMPERDCSA
jgi:hypothetical protein